MAEPDFDPSVFNYDQPAGDTAANGTPSPSKATPSKSILDTISGYLGAAGKVGSAGADIYSKIAGGKGGGGKKAQAALAQLQAQQAAAASQSSSSSKTVMLVGGVLVVILLVVGVAFMLLGRGRN